MTGGAGASGAEMGLRRVFLRDMSLLAAIGVHPHEHGGPQRIRVNVELFVLEGTEVADRLDRVVDYERVATSVRAIVGAGHIKLVETLAERIAASCLDDARVVRALVRVEKLDVFPDTAAVGVEVVRGR